VAVVVANVVAFIKNIVCTNKAQQLCFQIYLERTKNVTASNSCG
jgi:hypothetical protein